MKKYVFTIFATIILFKLSFSQTFNQDAQGRSTIIGLGGTLNADINTGLIKATYNKTSLKKKALLIGVDVQARNIEGTAALFQSGNFSPSGEASVLIGRKHSWQNTLHTRTYNLLYYTRLGIRGSEFTYDKGNAFSTVGTRFVNTTHISPSIEVGTSLRWRGNVYFGLLAGFRGENNQGSLSKSVYKYVVTDPGIPGLQQTKDITAYSGNYGRFSNTYINFDGLYLIPVDTIYIVPSLYFRYNISGNKLLQNNNGVVGASLNFVNVRSGKFFGGVYVQSGEVFDKGANTVPLYRKIEFGLVARFSFTSIRPF